MLNKIIENYIKPLELDTISYQNYKDGKLLRTKYDIIKDINDPQSEIFVKLKQIPKTPNSKDEIVTTIVRQWLSNISYELFQNAPYIFETDIDVKEDEIAEIMQKYFSKHLNKITTIEDFKDFIEDKMVDLFDFWDYEEEHKDILLSILNYDSIIEKLYELDINNYEIDRLDDYVDEIYDDLKYMNIHGYENHELYFNICPRQDGNDEGDKLGQYLDYIAKKLDEDYVSYYIHNREPEIPECLEFLLESQGYSIDDLFDIKKIESSVFLKTLIDEITELTNTNQFLTFLIKMNVFDVYRIQDKKEFEIPNTTTCGFANFVHGSLSGLSIKLEKPIKLNFAFEKEVFQFESESNGYGYGYSVNDIWGDCSNLYQNVKLKE